MSTLLKTSFAVLLCATAAISAKGQGVTDNPVYQSEVYYSGGFYAEVVVPNGVETGDQVNLAGTARVMTGFSFDYLASGLNGATAQVAFYDASGVPDDIRGIGKATTPINTPILWQTLSKQINNTTPGTISTLTYNNNYLNNLNNVLVPTKLIWTVTFNNLQDASVSLLCGYYPNNIGGGYAQYLTYNGTIWQPHDVSIPGGGAAPGGGAYFAATITAVPEPSTFALLGLGGFASMVLIRRRK